MNPKGVCNMSAPIDFEEIDDLERMVKITQAQGISLQGLQTLDQMRQRARKAYRISQEAFSVMTETREEVKRRQRHLLELFESTDACLNKLSDKDHALLELRVKNLKNRMAYHKQSLERTEYVVLVAGERNSKKSTLLSLILGEQLLPDSFLGTSSIICELRYGITHKIVAHFTDADPETGLHTKTIQLGQMAENSQQIFLQQISSFFLDQDRQGCNKVEIFWPNNLLKETIVIVDSPAFDELYIVDEKVKPYLSKAFAVICVINSLAQQHMIEEPIKKCRKVCLDQRRETSSIFPLFLCNDWDQLSQREADSIKNHVIGKLREYWPELDPDSQIIYFSSLNALNDEKAPKEFALLMDGIKSSALLNIKATLQKQWRWLNFVISCMAYHMKMVKDLLVSDDLRLDKRLRDVEKRLHSVEKEMQGYFRKMADDAARVLSKHLQTREVVEKFTSWTLDDIPKTESSWEVNEHFIQDAFMKRLQNTIAAWEDENHILSNTHISLVHFSNQRLNKEKSLLPLQYLENFVITDDAASESNICPSSNDFGAAKKVLIGVTSPIWVPVSLVVVPIFGVMTLKEKFKKRKDSTKYVKDQQGFIVKASREFLRHASKEQQLSSIVKEQLKDAQDHLTRASSRLRELTAAYKMLYHQLRDETRPKGKIKKSYGDLEEMSVRVKEKLALFFIKEVQYMVISRNDLEWDRGDQTSHLGKGAFASVYRGTFRIPRQREPAQVAVKLWNEELNESTAVGFLSKTEALRKLDFRFIVKFFGTALLREDGRWRVFHVMEMCEENLMNHILQNRKSIPALSVLCWAKDIAEAIEFIHSQGIVHRGLKLEKILLSQGNVIKVSGFRLPEEAKMITDMLTRTDANLTPEGIPNKEYDDKAEEEEAKMLTDTLKGTKAYLAPEVILNKEYDNKADIYSFGIMLWEMWYGERAFLEEGHALDKVVKGATPSHVQDDMRPSTGWQNLMQRCWDGKPNNRPDAAECHKVLTRLSQKVYPPSP
ncbi:uncharacterized protein LOC111335676 [Stylophora pistillata]|uniref:uncharacterized protein LOC111335676 n=1 Tax=Stylophora pistillata TaxID=50429 RepID=UPI000C053267|nr:uncharacterized protein LOC111335676 [Stylophora pistillata]